MVFSRTEAGLLFKLAIPVIISQVGTMTMGIVDSVIVGHYSSLQLAGVAAGNSIFWMIVMIGFGLLHGMDPIVAQAHGAGNLGEAERCLGSALKMGLIFSLIFTPIVYLVSENLWILGAPQDVIDAARPFLKMLGYSLWPLMIYQAIARYWQAFEIAMPFTITILLANLVNWIGNLAFVSGRWGMPALGAEGAALSTFICRLFTIAAALGISYYYWRKQHERPWQHLWALILRKDKEMNDRLFRLGLPASAQILLEVFAFSFTTIMVTRLGAQTLATHHIVLNIATFAFMFPVGLSSAIAVRVGYHRGRHQGHAALEAGWQGIFYAFLFMSFSALVLFLFPNFLLHLFTDDEAIVQIASRIIFLCALFQVFDGVQVASAGALRGLGDTKTALFSNLIAHYGIGLPIGLTLCFAMGKGLLGLWIGLALGLSFTAILNTIKWMQKKAVVLEA
ncbi:MAG: MATE family efflux transporter [Chitinophagaceae bacterium]|nr:MATE family efflux transporter [Oligoflexus sp.]